MSTTPDDLYSVALHIQDGKLYAFYELPDWSTGIQYSSFMKVDVITLNSGGTFNTSTTYNLANNTSSTDNTFMDFDVATLTSTNFFYKTDDRHGEIQTLSVGTSTTNAADWIGIAAEDIADAGTGKIDLYGAINRSQTGLTKDTNYYVNVDGTLVNQKTSYGFLGRAISTTDIQIFGKSTTEFTKSIDVDFTTNTPTTTSGLVLTSDGDSTYSFQSPVTNFNALTGQISANQIPNDIITNAMLNYTVNVFSQEFIADGVNNTYTLTSDPGSKNALQIFVDGVPQRASNYTVVGTTLTLGGTPTNGQIVEVRGYGVVQPIGTVADDSITGAKIQDGTIDLNKIAPGDYYSADTFTGDGNTAVYTLSTDPGSPWAITVYVAGVWQKPIINYGVVGTTLTLSSNVPNGEEIYVRYYGVSLAVGTVADDSITGAKIQDGTITADKIAGSEYLTQSFTGDGNSTDFTLSSDPGAQQALLVLIDNVIQVPVTNYTVTGTTLAFTGAPDLNADIFVRYLGLPSPLVTVADNSISTAKLQDISVSTAKLQDNSISTAKLQDNSISTAKLQDNSITNAKLNLTHTSTQGTGDDSTVDFTIEAGHTVNDIFVILDGYILPPEDYSIINGTTLRFGVAPLQDQSIDIRYLPV